jgi:hypothetical protein
MTTEQIMVFTVFVTFYKYGCPLKELGRNYAGIAVDYSLILATIFRTGYEIGFFKK